jgi:hypothetical protein
VRGGKGRGGEGVGMCEFAWGEGCLSVVISSVQIGGKGEGGGYRLKPRVRCQLALTSCDFYHVMVCSGGGAVCGHGDAAGGARGRQTPRTGV